MFHLAIIQKCMKTNHLNAYNNALMGYPQRGKARYSNSQFGPKHRHFGRDAEIQAKDST